jgi:Flp pilus assembly protein TadG
MKSPRIFRSGRGARGQALAEFAIVLPLILFFLAAILEFARAWNIKQAVTDAAREGARYVAVFNPAMTQSNVIAKVKERLALASIDSSVVTITSADPSCSPLSNCFHTAAGYGKEMTVNVSTQYRMGLVHVLMRWAGVPGTVTIANNATMRNE